MREAEMAAVAALVTKVLERPDDEPGLAALRREVEALCRCFPLYPGRWDDSD
jgi:glycine/serine hydroxymethyltransferase